MAITGIIVSAGIAFGEALHLNHPPRHLDYRPIPKTLLDQEQRQLATALQQLQAQLICSQASLADTSDNYQLIEADLLLLQDEELIAYELRRRRPITTLRRRRRGADFY
ncbi:MAG: phosphoenolpyruvate-utilizing N-terminal domain-containing protein [Shewanella sp.]